MGRTFGFDDYMQYSSRSAGPNTGRLKGWKNNIDDDHGELTAWLHVNLMPQPFWSHVYYTVVESKEKLVVFPRRFTCHENDAIAKEQKWRDDIGVSKIAPVVCPECILTNVVARLVEAKKLGFADVVFEWTGYDEETGKDKLVQILAGGIYGHFRKKKGLLRDHQVAMRRAGVKQTDAYRHDMRTGCRYLLAVLDDAHPDKGIQLTVESEGLGNKIRDAFLAEGKKVQATKRVEMYNERVRGEWDPSLNPYPVLLQYDNTKDFDDKFTVVPLRGMVMSDEIRAVIVDGELPELTDLEPGNCYDLRAELETHCKVDLPWDEIFGPATEAGLMTPRGESAPEAAEGDAPESERTPEVRGGSTKAEPVRIGPDHAAWKNKAYRPGAEFKGAEVHVCSPDGVTEADIARVLKAFAAVAKTVAEVVGCDHCGAEITTLDPSCPSCGAEVAEDGTLLTRPCLNPDCSEQVALEGNSAPKYICGKCGTIHEAKEEDGATKWVLVPVEEQPRVASARRRRAAPTASTSQKPPF